MENNSYSLTITIQDSTGGESPIANDQTANRQKEKTSSAEKLTTLVAHKITSDFLSSSKQILMNEVSTKVGSSELTQRVQLGMNLVKEGVGAVTGGLALSATLGLSGPAGIAIGASMAIMSSAINLITKSVELQNQKFEEQQALAVLRGRAGIQFNRSRGGE